MSHAIPSPIPVPTGPPRPPLHAVEPFAGPGRICQNPSCRNVASEDWDESGRLCGRCALEKDLFDREARRERSFPL